MLRQIPILEPSKQHRRQPLVQPFQPDPSCVLWVLPQRDNKWYDYSGKGNHGVIYDAVWKPSPAGVGLDFDGLNAYVDCGNDPSLNNTAVITIEAWVKKQSGGENDAGIACHNYRYPYGFLLQFNKLRYGYTLIDSNNEYIYSSHSILSNDIWYHVVVTHNFGTGAIIFYKNGIADIKTASYTGTGTAAGNLYLGVRSINDGHFNGSIGGVKIYNRVLSAAEIASIWRVERNWYGV